MSAIENLEQRLAVVEAELARMQEHLKKGNEPWWKEWMGAFQDDPYFEKAMKFGQQWRRGQNTPSRNKKRKPKNDRS
jgi:hypothetical protein